MVSHYSRIGICMTLLVSLAYQASAQLEVEGFHPGSVTGITEPRDGYPDISPDGKRIVFQSNRSGTWQLWVVNIDGTDLLRLTHCNANGTQIAFASNRGESGIFHLYLMAPDGSKVRRITQGPYNYTQPAWSADGKVLAAFRWIEDDAGEIGHIVMLDLADDEQ